jgi:tetratricopeptide (TPR) repeat protein
MEKKMSNFSFPYILLTFLLLIIFLPFIIKNKKKIWFFETIFILIFIIIFYFFLFPKYTKFSDEEFGIIVANFKGETEESIGKGKELKALIRQCLEMEFATYDQNKIKIKSLDEDFIPGRGGAQKLGKKYNADLVIYGTISGTGKMSLMAAKLAIIDTSIKVRPYIHIGNYLLDWEEVELPPAIVQCPQILYTSAKILAIRKENKFNEAKRQMEVLSTTSAEFDLDSNGYLNNFLGNFYFDQASVETDSLMRINFMEQAKREYVRTIRINPRFADSFNRLALIYIEEDSTAIAATHFEKAYEEQPQNYEYVYNLLITLYRIGQYNKAEKILSDFLKENPAIDLEKKKNLELIIMK